MFTAGSRHCIYLLCHLGSLWGLISDKSFALLIKRRNTADINTSSLFPTSNVDVMPGAMAAICDHEVPSMRPVSYIIRMVASKDRKRLSL